MHIENAKNFIDYSLQLETRLEGAMLEKTKLESEYVLSIQALRSDCEQLRKQVFERSRTFTEDSTLEGDDVAMLRLKLTEKEVQCVEFNHRLEALTCRSPDCLSFDDFLLRLPASHPIFQLLGTGGRAGRAAEAARCVDEGGVPAARANDRLGAASARVRGARRAADQRKEVLPGEERQVLRREVRGAGARPRTHQGIADISYIAFTRISETM